MAQKSASEKYSQVRCISRFVKDKVLKILNLMKNEISSKR